MLRALLLAVLLVPALSYADNVDHQAEVQFRLGAYDYLSKITINAQDGVGDGGVAAGARYLYNANPYLSAGLEFNVMDAGQHQSTKLITNGNTVTRLNTEDVLVVVRARPDWEKFKPYILGGFGLHSSALHLESSPQGGFKWANSGTTESRTLYDSRQTAIASSVESGFDYVVHKHFSAGIFAGLHFQGQVTYNPTSSGAATGVGPVKGAGMGMMAGGTLTAHF